MVLVESVHLMFKRIGIATTLAWLDALTAQGVGVFTMTAALSAPMNVTFTPIVGKISIRFAICGWRKTNKYNSCLRRQDFGYRPIWAINSTESTVSHTVSREAMFNTALPLPRC